MYNIETKDVKIFPLSPVNDLNYTDTDSKFTIYRKYLDEVFKDCRFKNIALTGTLGSGKSSILHSYDIYRNGNQKKEKFLYVSLIDFESHVTYEINKFQKEDIEKGDSTFTETEKFEDKHSTDSSIMENVAEKNTKKIWKQIPNEKRETQKRLEYSLLCQILARCKQTDIQESSLKGVPSRPKHIQKYAMLFTSIFTLMTMLFFYEPLQKLGCSLHIMPHMWEQVHFGLYIILIIVLIAGAFLVIQKIMLSIRLHKILIKTDYAEAEMTVNSQQTSLDQYKFEIIYALIQIADDIDYTVVFEDMDRLDQSICVEIMTKLRELNNLANVNLLVQKPGIEKSIR